MKSLKKILYRLRYALRHPLLRAGVIATLAVLLASLLVALAWWGPMKLEQWKSIEALEAKQLELHEAKRASAISQANRNALTTVTLIEKKLHAEMNQAQAVQLLSQLAARQKVRVLSQSFETGKKQEQIEALYIDLTLLGDYRGIRGMLAELPKMDGWIEVLAANLDSAAKGGAQVKCQLTLAVYRYAQNSNGRGGL
jgi:Tfp pilus assembly protein PilO